MGVPVLTRIAARWIGTPWWNLRFGLGRWVGGFDTVHRNYFTTTYANKLWGHGRLAQLRTRTACRFRGHDWKEWSENARRCRNGCGGVQFGGGNNEGSERWREYAEHLEDQVRILRLAAEVHIRNGHDQAGELATALRRVGA